MTLNKYIRNGEIQRSDGMTFLFGEAKYDPRAQHASYGTINGEPWPVQIPWNQIGRPGEMVFYIAGATYYPTRNGYEVL